MQLIAAVGTGFLAHLFQSSSGQKAGCNRRGRSRQKQLFVVSILIRPSGRMQHEIVALDGQDLDVSILIRPEGRMQLRGPRDWLPASAGFNPHPARRPDATCIEWRRVRHGCGSFNPHPARRPDATQTGSGNGALSQLFQSSSGQKAGCNPGTPGQSPRSGSGFNPHPAQKAGCNLGVPP